MVISTIMWQDELDTALNMLRQTVALALAAALVVGLRWAARQPVWRGCEMNSEKLERELAADRLLMVHFNLEAQIFDHPPDFWGRLARCREVAVYEDGVGWIERQRLETTQIMFAAAGDADFGMRVEEAKETEHFQTALRSQLVTVL